MKIFFAIICLMLFFNNLSGIEKSPFICAGVGFINSDSRLSFELEGGIEFSSKGFNLLIIYSSIYDWLNSSYDNCCHSRANMQAIGIIIGFNLLKKETLKLKIGAGAELLSSIQWDENRNTGGYEFVHSGLGTSIPIRCWLEKKLGKEIEMIVGLQQRFSESIYYSNFFVGLKF